MNDERLARAWATGNWAEKIAIAVEARKFGKAIRRGKPPQFDLYGPRWKP